MNQLVLLGGEPEIHTPLPDGTEASQAEVAAVTRALTQTPLTNLFGEYEVERFETLL